MFTPTKVGHKLYVAEEPKDGSERLVAAKLMSKSKYWQLFDTCSVPNSYILICLYVYYYLRHTRPCNWNVHRTHTCELLLGNGRASSFAVLMHFA